jgi:hypothetical protein
MLDLTPKHLTPKQLLNYKFYITEMGGQSTLRYYLLTLLVTLWTEEANFSGKRPLGDSAWQTTLANDLCEAGLLEGELLDGTFQDYEYDCNTFDKMILECIWSL